MSEQQTVPAAYQTGLRVDLQTIAPGIVELGAVADHRLIVHAGAPVRGACARHSLVYTRGDDVGTVGAAGLVAFLAPIESVFEAVVLAQIATRGSAGCEEPAARAVEGGHEVVTRMTSCGGAIGEYLVEVDGGGATTVVETVLLRAPDIEVCP